ncbi:UDP-N-acetylmuramate dehydrogenase [Candidatus Gottesmanbacteria bacterium]|nr:UDP-N-acetylmuramate dehydrogenase [Candidatus Gottesmanbacteria bacterium]
MDELYRRLQALFPDRSRKLEPMARHTTFKIGGPADVFIVAKSADELMQIIIEARRLSVPLFIFGGGSNILVGDKGIRGLVVKNMTSTITIAGAKGSIVAGQSRGNVFVEVDSGVTINKLVRFTIEEGLSGLEMQLGLPGTVGGAMYMNSKWTHPNRYVGDSVYQAIIVGNDGKTKVVPKSYFQFGYDTSILQKSQDIVIKVTFSLTHKDKESLWDRANASISYRRESQPQGVFSSGCTFRNISQSAAFSIPTPSHTTSAGFLVDHAGLKGESVGDAMISPVHANFIINKGKAMAKDVVALIKKAQERVKNQFGVILEEEIVYVGEF